VRRRAFVVALAFAALADAAAQSSASPQLAGNALAKQLRGGGVTLYFRHAATDFSQDDTRYVHGDCTTQRNLTEAGRADARAIGAELRRLRIPLGEVLASPFCRTTETATLIAGRATESPEARGGPAEADRYGALRKLLATAPASRTVRVVSSHGNPFRALTGTQLAEGEAAVVAPGPGDAFTVVARIPKDGWRALAR
jgi:phosphohistidine phosphatase SixA